MTPVGDYLKKLLYQYDCLVVPELGAFLTHYVSASFTESTNQYLPPRKRLAFNEALRLDDGILINYIMLHESITRDGAMRCIAQYVSGIRQQIRTSGIYNLEGIGLLTVNEEGKLQFDPELRHNFFAESFGLQPIQAQYCHPTEVSLPVVVLPVHTPSSLVLADSSADTGKLMPLPVKRSVWYQVAATLLIGSLATLSYVSVMQPNQLLQSNLNPLSLVRLPASPSVPTGTPAPISAPVVADKPVAVVVPPKAIAPLAPAVAAKAVVKPVPVLVAAVKKPITILPLRKSVPAKSVARTPRRVLNPTTVKPFLIVAGSFSSRKNALGLRRRLVKAGFDEAYLMMPVRRRELIKVAAFGASTQAEADTVMVKVRALTGVPAWLMRTRR
ncbi:MAG: HU-CCDC81 and SPOR domain-containing protein [Bacteroidetes bacterium]|nr:HU-CCDC81 and SPOR domain-containing protein [Fibrella sp.]